MTYEADPGFIFTNAFFDAFTTTGGSSYRRRLIPRGHLQNFGQL